MSAPDVVYVVRVGDKDEELRYSLRSLANLPHGSVWIAGGRPRFLDLDAVGHIEVHERPGGHRHAKAALRAACLHPDVSEEFYYFNDDFFVMAPISEWVVMHRGPLADHIASKSMLSAYTRASVKTADILRQRGIDAPLMYDLHAPLLVTKAGMLECLDIAKHANDPLLQERTLFGNLFGVGGEKRRNYKVGRDARGWQSWPFTSTNDNTFRAAPIGEFIRSKFPDRSVYEREPPAVTIRPEPRRPVRYRSVQGKVRAAA